eukprot:TRINITY_DN70998_c0_g1_i1.p1 TRINITY_DN70998_c0_g1~~TRINITY_DN70998_c0_g1_i1.p1  ORF type:complete len:115 (+),score=24.43 TRINITY_DN70998_c0_g1_i1:64-408(+)
MYYFFFTKRRPQRTTQGVSSAASDVYKRQFLHLPFSSRAVDDDPAMEKYYSANALYNKKLYKLAVDEYKNFMIHYPNHPKYLNAKLGVGLSYYCLLYTSPSPRDLSTSRMPSSA